MDDDIGSGSLTNQGRNREENLDATAPMVGRICPPPGWNRVKISENLGATAVAPVAPVDSSLLRVLYTNIHL